MPPKVRQLIAELERAGFIKRGGGGSHRNFEHPLCTKIVTVSGKTGNDALDYQIKKIKDALAEVKRNEKRGGSL
jgi:predicted RNA binding protein YcfA (HicA-like mRNA interferase family)